MGLPLLGFAATGPPFGVNRFDTTLRRTTLAAGLPSAVGPAGAPASSPGSGATSSASPATSKSGSSKSGAEGSSAMARQRSHGRLGPFPARGGGYGRGRPPERPLALAPMGRRV